eukprot:3537175-Rhodomonas_salina.2
MMASYLRRESHGARRGFLHGSAFNNNKVLLHKFHHDLPRRRQKTKGKSKADAKSRGSASQKDNVGERKSTHTGIRTRATSLEG